MLITLSVMVIGLASADFLASRIPPPPPGLSPND